jgi:hypothetical protein
MRQVKFSASEYVMHYVKNTRLTAYRNLPFIVCESHWLAISYGSDLGGIYSRCERTDCGTTAGACDRCADDAILTEDAEQSLVEYLLADEVAA